MRQIVKITVAVMAVAACGIVAGAEGRSEAFLLLLRGIAAIGIAAFLFGLFMRTGWRAMLACVWLAIVVGWAAAAFDGMGIRYVLDKSNLHCCIFMTMCSVALFAASMVLVKPCAQFGAGLRYQPDTDPMNAGAQGQRV